MDRKIALFVLFVLFFSVTGLGAAESDKIAAAVAESRSWLATNDRADYDDSWRAAATLLREAVPLAQWIHSMEAVRAPLGGVISRKLIDAVYRTTLPGAPDGAYVVIQYATEFENKKSAVETVTPMLDKDGQWRVSGYFIK